MSDQGSRESRGRRVVVAGRIPCRENKGRVRERCRHAQVATAVSVQGVIWRRMRLRRQGNGSHGRLISSIPPERIQQSNQPSAQHDTTPENRRIVMIQTHGDLQTDATSLTVKWKARKCLEVVRYAMGALNVRRRAGTRC